MNIRTASVAALAVACALQGSPAGAGFVGGIPPGSGSGTGPNTPDVCLRPPCAGSVPLPYPNIGTVNNPRNPAPKVKFEQPKDTEDDDDAEDDDKDEEQQTED